MQYRLVVFIFLMPLFVMAQSNSPIIHLNQPGFYAGAPKIAVVSGAVKAGRFYIIRANSKGTVFKKALTDSIKPMYSSAATRIADFSEFNRPGKYVLHVKGVADSYPFHLANNVQH